MSLDAAWARRWIELAAADVAEQRDYLVDLDRAISMPSFFRRAASARKQM